MWQTVHRNLGKLKKSDSGCITSLSGDGGKPVIQPIFTGSDASALNGVTVCAEISHQVLKKTNNPIRADKAVRFTRNMLFPPYLIWPTFGFTRSSFLPLP
jgi:hypothetical protein